ncbi:MAG: hypothetical protein ACJ8AH_27655, partial [Stellaceae bacterium]
MGSPTRQRRTGSAKSVTCKASWSSKSAKKEEEAIADNRQKVIDLDKKRMNAMAQKDIATLNALLSDDLVYTHSTA